jgi:hypothetical protein
MKLISMANKILSKYLLATNVISKPIDKYPNNKGKDSQKV